ncbi:MAG: FMN-binding protein [Kiritimatiellae bacterium]|nr:FMN-binding protein [Kiritimatiellia bacterium]
MTTAEARSHPDATYRGAFIDEGIIQVNLQFTLVDGMVTEASFRHLVGAIPEYNLDNQQEPYRSVVAQYEEALQHLVGKSLRDHLPDLYEPGGIITLEVDGYTGATIRSTKIISAVRDALNRGPYEF